MHLPGTAAHRAGGAERSPPPAAATVAVGQSSRRLLERPPPTGRISGASQRAVLRPPRADRPAVHPQPAHSKSRPSHDGVLANSSRGLDTVGGQDLIGVLPSASDEALLSVSRVRQALSRVKKDDGSVWELFCSHGELSVQLVGSGLDLLPGVDIVEGPLKWDLLNEGVVRRIFKIIRERDGRYVHFGTPCISFSMALRGAARTRSKANILGDLSWGRDVTANALVRNTVRIIRYLERLGRSWGLENLDIAHVALPGCQGAACQSALRQGRSVLLRRLYPRRRSVQEGNWRAHQP